MQAVMSGRVTGVRYEQGTGALCEVRVDTQYGNITIYKPDSWSAQGSSAQGLVGEIVKVTVDITVNP